MKLSVLIRTSTRAAALLVDQEVAEDGRDAALLLGVVLQAVAEDGKGVAAEVLDLADQGVDRRDVLGHPVGAIEEDADRRAVRVGRTGLARSSRVRPSGASG